MHFHTVTAQCHTVYGNFQKVQLKVNKLCVFQAIYLGHFLHNFHAQGITLKGKALATKCLFQNHLQLMDNLLWLIFKTAEKLFCVKCTFIAYWYAQKPHFSFSLLLSWLILSIFYYNIGQRTICLVFIPILLISGM